VVSASYNGLSDSVTIVVKAPVLNRIALVPPNSVLRPNLIYPFRSYALYSDGTVQEVPRDDKYWTSDDPSIAEPYNYTGYFGVWAQGVGTTELHVNYDTGMGQTAVQVFNSPITGVEVSPAKVILPVGTAAKLAGVFAYKSMGDGWAVEIQNPDWSSHDASIVSVDTNGVATARLVGNSAIDVTATDASTGVHTATAQVQVTNATISSIALALPARMVVGLSAKVHAMGTFSDGTVMDLGPSPVIWFTSDNSLATINPEPDGTGVVVKAKAAGSVTVGATMGTVTTSVPITLVSTTLSTLALNVSQTTLAQGSTSLLTTQGTFADGTVLDLTDSATYTSSAPDVAQVLNGMFTTLDWLIVQAHVPDQTPATADLTASFLGKTSPKVTLQVNGPNLRSLALAVGAAAPANPLTLSGPGPFQLRVVGTFTDNSTADVTAMCTFEPASPSTGIVATISNARAGKVTLLGHGTEQVKATYAPSYIGQPLISGTATLTVP